MSSLKSLRVRIKSVKSTQKITKAMTFVSSAKLHKAKEHFEASYHYTAKIYNLFRIVKAASRDDQLPNFVLGSNKKEKFLIVVVTSDKGLCGAFNSSVIKQAKDYIKIVKNLGKDFEILCVGKKGYEVLKWEYYKKIINYPEALLSSDPKFALAEKIVEKLLEKYNSGEFDICKVFYNKFISTVVQKSRSKNLIPFEKYLFEDENSEEKHAIEEASLYDYEPADKQKLLNHLSKRSFIIQMYSILLQNSVGEYSARMMAMDSASNNAGKMIDKLSLVYNRKRQSLITSELIEVISCAEVV